MAAISINLDFKLDVNVILLAILDPLNNIFEVFLLIHRQTPGAAAGRVGLLHALEQRSPTRLIPCDPAPVKNYSI
jgi:hypothetical protein